MHAYRTHTCAALTKDNVGDTVRLSGWVHNKRDHGGVLFVDLRDHYGITQRRCRSSTSSSWNRSSPSMAWSRRAPMPR